ncbi:hypothetical protein Afer_0012 [Acidimicrobium ferrooxidans DSM 10331]|uniref:Uncharacterized protein n=1 Tax=Acidimicrobium ferrooxidans (strain DSM 10331 / JCM 15462 / NBRC 103882 / ICP) TaxID=525909 RepID=C7M1D8_ACIFD|nr:hypothetical protein [Acidimicrobium ferrooxidans]ACU52987.1 hypothetical protein Afer_0012 [Acidimicrobium ferrooxidans DSM 10331]
MRAPSEQGDATPALLAVGSILLVMGLTVAALVLESITMAETMARAAARAAAHAAANVLWQTAGNAGSPGLVTMRNPSFYDPNLQSAASAALAGVPHGVGTSVVSCSGGLVPNGHGLQRYYLDVRATCTVVFVPPMSDLITVVAISPITVTASAHLVGSLA